MNAKQKWMIVSLNALVFSIIAFNFAFNPSVTEYVIELVILVAAQIFGVKMLKIRKPNSKYVSH
jgi:hypothetical protein